jgi:hypothetical protein
MDTESVEIYVVGGHGTVKRYLGAMGYKEHLAIRNIASGQGPLEKSYWTLDHYDCICWPT